MSGIGNFFSSIGRAITMVAGAVMKPQAQANAYGAAYGGVNGQSAVSAYIASHGAAKGPVDIQGAMAFQSGNAGTLMLLPTAMGGSAAAAQAAPGLAAGVTPSGVTLTDAQKLDAADISLAVDRQNLALQAAGYAAATANGVPQPNLMKGIESEAIGSVNNAIAAVGGPTTTVGAQLQVISNQMSQSTQQAGLDPSRSVADGQTIVDSMTKGLNQAQDVLNQNSSIMKSADNLAGAAAVKEQGELTSVAAVLNKPQNDFLAVAQNPNLTGAARDKAIAAAGTHLANTYTAVASSLGAGDPLAAVLSARANGLNKAIAGGEDGATIATFGNNAIAQVSAELQGLRSLIPSPAPQTTPDAPAPTPKTSTVNTLSRQNGVPVAN